MAHMRAASKESQRFRYIQVQAHRRITSSEQVEYLRTLLARVRPSASIWNSFPAMRPTSTHKKGFGICSNDANSKMYAVGILTN